MYSQWLCNCKLFEFLFKIRKYTRTQKLQNEKILQKKKEATNRDYSCSATMLKLNRNELSVGINVAAGCLTIPSAILSLDSTGEDGSAALPSLAVLNCNCSNSASGKLNLKSLPLPSEASADLRTKYDFVDAVSANLIFCFAVQERTNVKLNFI